VISFFNFTNKLCDRAISVEKYLFRISSSLVIYAWSRFEWIGNFIALLCFYLFRLRTVKNANGRHIDY
jgi:hypothetical protein